jgi:phage terminase large subunit
MILIDYAQTNRNKKIDIMSESYPHLEDGAIKDFREIMLDRGYWDDNRWNSTKHTYEFETGTIIKFISIDKLGKAHGPRRDVLFINEANNIDYSIYDQLEIRTKEIVWLDWNPTVEFWYYQEIKDVIDHDFLTLTYLDCLDALDPRIVESIESKKHKTRWWKVYGLGQLGEVEGRIFKGWKIIDEIPHEARLRRRGLDFGFTNDPTVIEDIYEYNGGYIVDERVYQKGLSNKSIADLLKNMEEPQTLVIADSAEPKSIDEIKSYGLNIIGAIKGQGSVMKTIDFVQDQKISVTRRSKKTITAYNNYMFLEDKKTGKFLNEPDDGVHEWSNPMDAIRYGLDTNRTDNSDQFKSQNKSNFR